VITFIT